MSLPSPAAMISELKLHLESVQAKAIKSITVVHGEITVTAQRDSIAKLLEFLRDDSQCRFETLVDLCGCDYPTEPERFEIVYHMLSMRLNQRIRVKVRTDEATPAPSVTSVFPVANWYEREAFDMYGIIFSGHPDLRRILTDYGFEGYPLRKDFPLTGRVQVRYDEAQKRVINEPVKLVQEYRNFDFLSPWEGMQSVIPGDEKAGGQK
ncbi:MAG: NADH-quinone oxidoreductase subunit C [Hyphomonadaceae bacterium]|nr:NADH-quinone oxidoreductase subunit C [Hyphomonadaceae bacterium]